MYNEECNTFVNEVSSYVFMMLQGIVGNRYLGRNLLIGHKHGKEIFVIARFVVNSLWKEIITCLCVHHVEE
jgi:hypothetical protein